MPMRLSSSRPEADVITSELLDRLVVMPRPGIDVNGLATRLRACVPSLAISRTAQGLSVPAEVCASLLNADPEINLVWRSDARLFAKNRKNAYRVHDTLRERVRQIVEGGADFANNLLGDLEGIEQLDDHQKINVAAMTIPECYGLCVFDEQGAGKTVTLIFAFDLLMTRDVVDIAVIIAPKSMVAEWPVDLHRFKGDLYKSVVVAGNYHDKRRALAAEADFYVTNFETAVSMETDIVPLVRRHKGRALLAVDESFFVKNLDAKRTRAIRRLRESFAKAYVLCGTPAPNSPSDLVQQFNLVDFGITFGGVSMPDDHVGARQVVQQAIKDRGVYIRHLKRDVLPDLPQKTFHRVLVPLATQQATIYRGLLGELIGELSRVDDNFFQRNISSFLARRSALLQACSNPIALTSSYTETPAKLAALDELLEELIEKQGEKTVVWSFYTASLNAIVDRYRKLNPVRYDGTVTSVESRRDAVRRFQEDNTTMLFVANPAAAGAGLTLHRARFAVYESLSNQAAHYLQSIDRLHRRGQQRDVEYVILLCDHTLEVQEYDRLIGKEAEQYLMLGDDQTPPITRETMLNELLVARTNLG